jgi:acetyl-CoA carboxylase biotin carboxyl carrier protein
MGHSPSGQDIFDVRKIRRLVQLMKEHGLTAMDLQQSGMRIRLRRGGGSPVRETTAPAAAPPPAAPAPNEAPRPAALAPVAAEAHIVFVKSPMVGTFYAAPDPDSPPFVKVGDSVGPGTVVCIVEAMKVFNEIQAEVAGKIVAVLVENGEPVEFGQPLFKVDTRQ